MMLKSCSVTNCSLQACAGAVKAINTYSTTAGSIHAKAATSWTVNVKPGSNVQHSGATLLIDSSTSIAFSSSNLETAKTTSRACWIEKCLLAISQLSSFPYLCGEKSRYWKL